MKTTLLVSIYDGIYGGYSAMALDMNALVIEEVSLSKRMIQVLDKAVLWGADPEERSVEFTKLLDEYDAVIVCNNGKIYKVK